MIKLFQRDMAVQAILLVATLLLLWGRALWAPAPMESGDHPAVLYGLLCQWLAPVPRLAVVIAMLLVLAEAVTLNLLLADVGLVSQNSLLPALLYTAAASAATSTLTPVLFMAAAVIASLRPLLLRGTLLTITPDKICGATLLLSTATLFYQPALLLMVSYLLIAFNYRLYSWKDWALMLLGFAIPYTLLALVLYVTDGWTLSSWQLVVGGWQYPAISAANCQLPTANFQPALAASLVLAALLLWSLFDVISHIGEHPVVWQRNVTTVLLFTVGGIGMMLCHPLLPFQTALFAIPFAFCTYHLLVTHTDTHHGHRRKNILWIYDLLLILIPIAALLC